MTETYRSLDDVSRLLADVWATYPAVYAIEEAKTYDITLAVLPNIIANSAEYCKALDSGKTDLQIIARGGFGEVGPFRIESDGTMKNVSVHVVSFRDSGNGKYVPYFMQVYAKKNVGPPQELILYVGKNGRYPGRVFYVSNDFLHESIIGGLVSHLYDIGVSPCVTKQFGTYVCEVKQPPGFKLAKKYTSMSVMEKSTIELSKVLGGLLPKTPQKVREWGGSLGGKFFNQINVYDIEIWLVQLAHAFFINKLYFGITHLDVHLRNVLLTYVKSSGLSLQGPEDHRMNLVYGGKLLANVDYIRYTLPFSVGDEGQAYLVVENNGLIPKLIDYGLTIADFTLSSKNKKMAFRFENSTEIYSSIDGGTEAASNVEGYGDVEWNYICYNLVFQLYRLERYGTMYGLSSKERLRAKKLRESLEFFFSQTVSNYDISQTKIDLNGSRRRLNQDIDNLQMWFMSYRDVGTTSNIIAPLYRIFYFLKNHGKTIPGKNNEVYITRSGLPPPDDVDPERILNIGMNPSPDAKRQGMSRYLTESKRYYHMCLLNGGVQEHEFVKMAKDMGVDVPVPLTPRNRQKLCNSLALDVEKLNPNSILKNSVFRYSVDKNSGLWDSKTKSLRNGITLRDLRPNLRKNILGKIYLFDVYLYPQSENMSGFEYNPSQILMNNQPPPEEMMGQKLTTVNFRMIYYRNNSGLASISHGGDVFDACIRELQNIPFGVSIAGGVYVEATDSNSKRIYRPVGFHYNKLQPELSEKYVPVPQAYQSNWGVVMVSGGNIKLGKYSSFLSKHITEDLPVVYKLTDEDGKKNTGDYKTTVKQIKLIDGHPRLKDGSPVPYNYAMSSGPMLIWNGQIILSQDKMRYSQFILDVSENPPLEGETPENYTFYKLRADLPNVNMYFSEPGEDEKNYLYGQRNSNHITAHSVIAETKSGDVIFFFIEGQGFDALGLDRVELGKLISKFDIKTAFCLDGGFNANAVVKMGPTPIHMKWLMPSVEYQKPISTQINIGIFPDQDAMEL